MKNKCKTLFKFTVIGIAVFIGCLWLFYLLDKTFNGIFVDWFAKAFLIRDTHMIQETGEVFETQRINWYALKMFLLTAFVVFVLVVTLLIRGITAYRVKKLTEENVAKVADSLHSFLETGGEFPPMSREYAQVENQMLQIRDKEQRQMQMLEKETQQKNDLITYLAHDLKTPLASVIGYLSLLDEVPDMPPGQKAKYIGITLDKAYRLEQLIDEFFDITRFNLHSIQLSVGRTNLSFLLQQLAEQFYPILSQQQKKVRIAAGQELWIRADGEKLARVFNNILKNAIAYSYQGTTIEIAAYLEQGKVLIVFQNQGDPIPAQQLKLIFEKFYRLDGARSTNTGGAGLGLAIAKEIVTAHGGEISAESSEAYTRFTVALPYRDGNPSGRGLEKDMDKKQETGA